MFAQPKIPTVGFAGCILALVLGMSPTAAVWAEPSCHYPEIEKQFIPKLQEVNRNIRLRQELLEQKLNDPMASEAQIKEMNSDLSRWKAKRETLAIDYILRRRRDNCPLSPDLSPLKR